MKQLSVNCSGNPKLTGGSIIKIVESKTTLMRVYEITLTGSAPLGLGTNFNQNPYPRRHYKLMAQVGSKLP